MVLVKKLKFFHLYILGYIGQENVFFCYSREEKGVFFTLKSQS